MILRYYEIKKIYSKTKKYQMPLKGFHKEPQGHVQNILAY